MLFFLKRNMFMLELLALYVKWMKKKWMEQFYAYHSMNYYEVITHKSIVMHTFIPFSGEDNKIL